MQLRQLQRTRAAIAAAIFVFVVAGAAAAVANVDYVVPMTDPMEQGLQLQELGDGTRWDVAVVRTGTLFYKGMDVTCNRVMANADINNKFVQAPTWVGDPETANAYAIRSTAKVYLRAQRPIPNGHLEQYDPAVATIAEYRAVRPLRLLVLIDQRNIANLLAAIQAGVDRRLQTGIGAYLRHDDWIAVARDEDEVPDDVYARLYLLTRPEHRAAVDAYIRAHGDEPLGMTAAELDFMRANLRASGWDETSLGRRVARRNQREAAKVVDELIALQREAFVVRFATGYGMTWQDQKRVLGDRRVAARGLTDAAGFPGGAIYDVKLPGVARVLATIGPRAADFNRISLMDKDLELVEIIKKYANVDGYWAPEVPSLWHRDMHFHSEAAVIYPSQAIEHTGRCLPPPPPEDPEEEDD